MQLSGVQHRVGDSCIFTAFEWRRKVLQGLRIYVPIRVSLPLPSSSLALISTEALLGLKVRVSRGAGGVRGSWSLGLPQ